MERTFYSDTPRQVLDTLDTDPDQGLTQGEGARRLAGYGENKLEKAKPPGLFRQVLAQLRDPMILVLLAAAALSFFAGGGQDWLDTAIILLIVVFNTVISVSQEDNARKALEALEKLAAPRARVLREGVERRLESTHLVPGDILLLEAGDYVPADGRILWAAGLQTDESAMTGESLPVHKRAGDGLPPDTPLAERKNMVIGGTVVTGGRAKVVVTATGMQTEMGKIAGLLLRQGQGETPLQRKMKEVSRVLSLVCVGVCAVMFGVGMLQHRDILDMFLTAVALAVAAIPEGLPAIVTIVLAVGVGRMARRNAIIKRLPAVETLGCASVICSDKTGTLTKNQMTVLEVWTPAPAHRDRALTLGTLCGDAQEGPGGYIGDPTETAIAQAAAQAGLEKAALERDMPRRGEAPFDSVRKRMATCHALPNGEALVAVKGAPEAVLARCTHLLGAQGPRPLTDGDRRRIAQVGGDLAGQALRVLAVAQRLQPALPKSMAAEGLEAELTFVGLIGMMDPPRPEVRQAVDRCAGAGIRPVMITGDHKDTAVAIAKQLNIYRPGDKAIDGAGLDFLPQETLEEEIEAFSVYARVTPEQRRPRPEGRRHRLRHGKNRHRRGQGGGGHDPHRRQLRHGGGGGGAGAGDLCQHPQGHPLPPLLQHWGDFDHLPGHPPAGFPGAPEPGAAAVAEPGHRLPPRPGPGDGAGGENRHDPAPSGEGGTLVLPGLLPPAGLAGGPGGGDHPAGLRPGVPPHRDLRRGQHHGLCHPHLQPALPRL